MQDLMEMVSRLALLFIPGVIFLLFGRRLFWLLGGLVTGILAMAILSYFLQPEVVEIAIDPKGFRLVFEEMPNLPPILLGAGIAFVVGIILTLRFPRAASGLVGFVVGNIIVLGILELYAVSLPEPARRTLMLLGGVGIAIVGIRNQNQTMILLSTFLAAAMVLQGLGLNRDEAILAIVWLVLMLTGIIFQTNDLRVRRLKAGAGRAESAATLTPNA